MTSIHTIDESNIERYVRYPDTLPAEMRQKIANAIEANANAQAIAAFYETYYDELDGLADYTPPEIERFINTLFSPVSVVPLFPHEPESTEVLSIQTSLNGHATTFDTVTLLASHIPHVLVCILRSRLDPQQYRLKVLADAPKKRAHVLVSFPELNQDLITDTQGIASFHLPTPEALPYTTATLHFPIDEVYLSTDQLDKMRARNVASLPVLDMQLSLDEKTRTLHLKAPTPHSFERISYVTGQSEEGTTQLFRIDHSQKEVTLATVTLDRPYWIRLYA